MYYVIYKNSLTYCRISCDCAVSRSPQVNMSAQARPPRRAMATYSRKNPPIGIYGLKEYPKKMSYLSRYQRIATVMVRKARLAINLLTKPWKKVNNLKL